MEKGSQAYLYSALLIPLPNGTIPTIPTAKINGTGHSYPAANYVLDGAPGRSLHGNLV